MQSKDRHFELDPSTKASTSINQHFSPKTMKLFGLIFVILSALLAILSVASVEAAPEPQFVVVGGRGPAGFGRFRGFGRPFRGGFGLRGPFFG